MARPANSNPEETKRRLVAAGVAHFARHGLDSTSLRAVAKDADVTMAMVRYYFGSKDGLFEACRSHVIGEFSKDVAALAPIMTDLREMLEAGAADDALDISSTLDNVIRVAFRAGVKHREAIQVVMRPLLDTGELNVEWRDKLFEPFITEGAVVISGVLGLPKADTRAYLQTLLATGVRYALSSPAEMAHLSGLDKQLQDEEIIERTADMLVRVGQRLFTGE